MEDQVATESELFRVEALTVIAGTGGPQRATITLNVEGRHETREATGSGPVTALTWYSVSWAPCGTII
ncbi:MAG TPA: alpha-isopropylmalate synthase regulatory domain-containing protein [Afifellaceae bacterium]|nr:alpha-isopropylmalate synthase regulatory domain-containing protein [Afifellaceae bacterium]